MTRLHIFISCFLFLLEYHDAIAVDANKAYKSLIEAQAHNNQIMNKYFDKLNDIFTRISRFENGEENVEDFMETEVCISGLRDNKQA